MANNDYRLQLIADLSNMEKGLAKITNQLAGVVGGLKETDAALKTNSANSNAAAEGQKKFTTSLNSTRYALYDVSRTLTIAGAALIAFALAPTKVAIDFQREFANVQRTVSGAGQDIKDQLKELSTQIPATFKDLTEIASLGGQLGIAKGSIIDFTSTVAKLTATTNLTAEVAGTALGRFQSFGLVTSKQFANLASAILKVGVNSVATESQIVTIATRIAGIGVVAGLSAQTLVGYAGALASVGVQTFAASGSTIRLVQKMQAAVSDGGKSLDTFAKVAGVSTEQFREAFGTAKFNPIFQAFIANMGNVKKNGEGVNQILKDIGLTGAIDSRTFTQLAAASGTVTQGFSDANTGFKDAKTLNEQYGRVAATTASKITELGNSILNLLDTIGSQTNGPLSQFIGMLLGAANGLGDFLKTTQGQNISLLVTGFTLLSGILLLIGGVAARAAASFIGLATSISGMNAEAGTGVGIMAALNAELAASGPAGAKAAAGFAAIGNLAKAGVAAVAVGVLAIGLKGLIEQEQEWAGTRATVDGMSKTLDKTGDSYKKLINSVVNSKGIFGPSGGFLGLGNAASADRQLKGFYDFMDSVNQFNPLSTLNHSLDTTGISKFRDDIKTLDQTIGKDAGKNANQAAIEYKYLSDQLKAAGYSSKEIVSILPVSTAALAKHKEEVAAAAAATDAFAQSIGASATFITSLQAATGLNQKGIDDFTKAYQKSVQPLTDFNNIVKQVQDAQAKATRQAAMTADEKKKQAQSDADASVSLAAFTAQLQANNAAQQTWATNLIALSAQAGPAAAQQFIDAGYSAVNASILQQLVDATPAQRDEYIAAQQEAAQLASDAMASALLASGFLVTDAGGAIGKDTAAKLADGIKLGLPVEALMQSLNIRLASNPLTPVANTEPAESAIMAIATRPYPNVTIGVSVNLLTNIGRAVNNAQIQANQYAAGNAYASGGLVHGPGTGTSDSIPARLSAGEYVIKASRVRALGVGYLDGLNGGRSRTPGRFAEGGPVSAGVGMSVVELGPQSMSVLRQAVAQEVGVYLGDENIARAANRGNAKMNIRGAR